VRQTAFGRTQRHTEEAEHHPQQRPKPAQPVGVDEHAAFDTIAVVGGEACRECAGRPLADQHVRAFADH
jgi:hypothetical protein